MLPYFRAAARALLEAAGGAEDAVAMALAKMTGNTELKARSLLTAHKEFTTLQYTAPYPLEKPGQVFGWLRKRIGDEDPVNEAKRMTLTANGSSAVFDVPTTLVKTFMGKCGGGGGVPGADEEGGASDGDGGGKGGHRLFAPTVLPELKERPADSYGSSPGGFGGRGGRGGGGGFGGRGGGGSYGGGRGRGSFGGCGRGHGRS